MSDPAAKPTIERSGAFRPLAFLLGLGLSLVLCSATARVVSRRGYHTTFTRFHTVLSPAGQYYPTLEEMCGIVRMRCRPGQILVIVGGNSVFEGVGQPAAKLWTAELQRLLGARYVVVNFAFGGALCTDGGARVAEVLRREYPRQIYVANTAPFNVPFPYGIEPYRYLLWEARSRGLLEAYRPRDAVVDRFVIDDFNLGGRFELRGKGWLDRVLRFRDFWNWVGYDYLFTIENPLTPSLPKLLWPRSKFPDDEPDFDSRPLRERYSPANREAEMKIVRAFSGHFYEKDSGGDWRPIPKLRQEFETMAKAAFPDDQKPRTLIMLSRNSPVYLRQLTADEVRREDAAYRDGVEAWREAGYQSGEYGRDFKDVDFGDRTHLAASGGRKLAATVADRVRAMASSLGYSSEGGPK
jgi:hypothetical protein